MSDPITADNKISTVSGDKSNVIDSNHITAEEPLLEDALTKTDDYTIVAKKRDMVEQDDVSPAQFTHYVDRKRRKKLDGEIEELYTRVAAELNNNAKEVMFALEKLRKAQGIILEDANQYEEALYCILQVKEMLVKKHNLKRYIFWGGSATFVYGLVWLVIFIYGFFVDVTAVGIDETNGWFSALAGGIGGVVIVLYDLAWQVSIRQEFDRQHFMKYLLQPIMGFGLGIVIFFITSVGFLAIDSSELTNGSTVNLGGSHLLVSQILLGFIAGFSQQFVYATIDRIVSSLSPSKAIESNATKVNFENGGVGG